ncbi:GNAT family N-acetyltransferase [Streptomyces phaeofaciens JCM 4814]|uniref:N-acetyltransferase n=1 Tax=Streptomyces phaeofaciens TaxID=68254 RepID=A0A918HQ34_9ACTN|nr:GNAT family N-acetyltransferase [Streptomyces phaeofaciens]GGT86060.1 N-acetyltransferase [Streptomyces phaeofaciens]
MSDFSVRGIQAQEWGAVKALRLLALQDPMAPLAFLETYEHAVEQPDSFWQERASRAGEGALAVRQFIAETEDGVWVGTLTVLVEAAGTVDWAGYPVEHQQGHVVGVYVRPEWRGGEVIRGLFDAALEWAWEHGLERVRLIVHEENLRAQGAYRKFGFVPSGVTVALEAAPGESELEFVLDGPGGSHR